MKNIRYGVVGLGSRGRHMSRLASTFDCAEFVAACDIKETNWTEKQWRAPAPMKELFPEAVFYNDYETMLNEANLDLVLVETGADVHADFCIKALEKNINVLTDIPVVASLDEADRLWKAHLKSKAMISVGANPNYQKFTVVLNDFYNKGLLGKPYFMEAEYIHWFVPNSPAEIHYNENGDWRKLLVPIRYSTHSLGPLLTIVKNDLKYVSCFGTGKQAENSLVDDMMAAQFQTEDGVVIRLARNGWSCRAKIGHHNYRVFGTEGYMERIDRLDKPVIRYNSTKELDVSLKEISGEYTPPQYVNDEKAQGHGGIDYAVLDNMFDALLNDKPAPISLKEGLRMTLPGIYAEESAKRGGEVIKMLYPWDKDWTTKI